MLTAGSRASPFGDLANGATAAGADAGTGVQRANLLAGGWRALDHSLPQPVCVPSGKVAALCHGWIDGQLDKYDDACWLIRFTPRKPRSKWSEVNRTRALQLIEAGRMQSAGLAQIEAAKNDGRWEVAYAPASRAEEPPDLQAALNGNPKAATFFATLTGANRYAILYRIGAVKRPDTRARKIASFVAMLERGETLHG